MKPTQPTFASEAALCEAFIAWAKDHGWTAYAETAGWDIVMVRPSGVQIGIQAKLRFNTKVLAQTLPHYLGDDIKGPDYRAILIGAPCEGCERICEQLGIAVFYPHRRWSSSHVTEFSGDDEVIDVEKASFRRYNRAAWFDWNPQERIELPKYIPDVAAGASGPVQLTPWKIGALHLTALLELRGFITRSDFKAHGINPSRWTIYGANDARAWIVPGAERGQWVRGPALRFDEQHPKVYEQIKVETAQSIEGVK